MDAEEGGGVGAEAEGGLQLQVQVENRGADCDGTGPMEEGGAPGLGGGEEGPKPMDE